MTPDLFYLTLSAGLCAVLWIPYIAGLIKSRGANAEDYRVPPNLDLPPWLKRANRAHLNMVENLPVFASLVLVAHLSETASSLTAIAAAVFFWGRVAQAVVQFAGWPYVRTLAFVVSWLAMLTILWEILV